MSATASRRYRIADALAWAAAVLPRWLRADAGSGPGGRS